MVPDLTEGTSYRGPPLGTGNDLKVSSCSALLFPSWTTRHQEMMASSCHPSRAWMIRQQGMSFRKRWLTGSRSKTKWLFQKADRDWKRPPAASTSRRGDPWYLTAGVTDKLSDWQSSHWLQDWCLYIATGYKSHPIKPQSIWEKSWGSHDICESYVDSFPRLQLMIYFSAVHHPRQQLFWFAD